MSFELLHSSSTAISISQSLPSFPHTTTHFPPAIHIRPSTPQLAMVADTVAQFPTTHSSQFYSYALLFTPPILLTLLSSRRCFPRKRVFCLRRYSHWQPAGRSTRHAQNFDWSTGFSTSMFLSFELKLICKNGQPTDFNFFPPIIQCF